MTSSFYEGKRVLVTGGTGFVGTHLVEELLRHGAKIRISLHKRSPVVNHPDIETVQADLTRMEDCRAAVRGMQYVFHAAGAVSGAGPAGVRAMSYITTNLVLTAQMLEAAWSEGVERFLIFSSSTGYPAAAHPVNEEEMWSGPPDVVYFGYGWMRRYFERISEFVASKSSMGIALVRPTAVYGRWDNFDPLSGHVIPALIRRAVSRENPFVVWGTGNEVRDFLHISDLARGCVSLLEKHATCDPVNIGYGQHTTIKTVVQVILEAAGHTAAEIQFDTSKPTTIPTRMVDTSKAKRLLGFTPSVSLEQGLKDTVDWYRQNYRTPHSDPV